MNFFNKRALRYKARKEALKSLTKLTKALENKSAVSEFGWRQKLCKFTQKVLDIRVLLRVHELKADCKFKKDTVFYRKELLYNRIDQKYAKNKRKLLNLKKEQERLQKVLDRKTCKFDSEMQDIDRTHHAFDEMTSGLCDFLSEKWKDNAILQVINEYLRDEQGLLLPERSLTVALSPSSFGHNLPAHPRVLSKEEIITKCADIMPRGKKEKDAVELYISCFILCALFIHGI